MQPHSGGRATAPGVTAPGPFSSLWLTCTARVSADGLQALREPAGVALLGARERLEPLGDLVKALVARGASKTGVHLGVLVGLAGDGRLEVVGGRADGDTG